MGREVQVNRTARAHQCLHLFPTSCPSLPSLCPRRSTGQGDQVQRKTAIPDARPTDHRQLTAARERVPTLVLSLMHLYPADAVVAA